MEMIQLLQPIVSLGDWQKPGARPLMTSRGGEGLPLTGRTLHQDQAPTGWVGEKKDSTDTRLSKYVKYPQQQRVTIKDDKPPPPSRTHTCLGEE